MNTITSSAPAIARALARLRGNVNWNDITFRFRETSVKVELSGRALELADRTWEILMEEFRNEGWGFHTEFRNGIDKPRTATVFDHPVTLTRY